MGDKDVDLKSPKTIQSFEDTHYQDEQILSKGNHNINYKFKFKVPTGKKYRLTVVATLTGEKE